MARSRLPLSKVLILAMVETQGRRKRFMAKVTSKYQVTVPRRIADAYHIGPGDEIDWAPAGDVIRVVPPDKLAAPQGRESQLHWFDQATERHRKRLPAPATGRPRKRGWTREDLYRRGRPR
jgi:bifunctional DNA-binding transcriptional regulator/antitoxin component of YhaV-PrlF toxin-antitoxin module